MKYGNIGKYLKEAGVSTTREPSLEMFDLKLPDYDRELDAIIAMEAFDIKGMVDKFIAFLKKLWDKGVEYYNKVVERVRSKIDEVRAKVKKYFNRVGEIKVDALINNSIVEDGQFNINKFNETMQDFNFQRASVAKILEHGLNLSDNVASGATSLGRLVDRMNNAIELQVELTDKYKGGSGGTVEVTKTTRAIIERILDMLNDELERNPYYDLDKQLKNLDLKKHFSSGTSEDELNEYLPVAMSIHSELMEKVKVFSNTRIWFITRLIAGIGQAADTLDSKSSNEDYTDEEIVYDDGAPAHLNSDTAPLMVGDQPDNVLFEQLNTISTEALVIGNFARYFSRKADALNIAVQEGFKYLTTYNYEPMETLHPFQMDNYCSTLDFFEHEDLKVPQPAGFKGELLPYTALLIERAKVMNKVLDNVLKPATSRFGHYLSIPMDRAERRDFEFGINIADNRDKMVKEDATLFGSNRSGQASLGALFGSFSDFVEAERNMLTVKATLGEGGMDAVKKSVQALTITAQALIKRLGQDERNKPSGEFVKMISEQLTEVAKWVEWYAGQMTRIIETNNTLYEAEKVILTL